MRKNVPRTRGRGVYSIFYTSEVIFVDCRAFFETKLIGQVKPALNRIAIAKDNVWICFTKLLYFGIGGLTVVHHCTNLPHDGRSAIRITIKIIALIM